MGLEIHYPYTTSRYVDSKIEAYDIVNNNSFKTGNYNVIEDTFAKIERLSKDSERVLGEEKFKLTEVDNNSFYGKSKTTHEFPDGKKYQIFGDGNIKRIRKFENGKWSLIGFETPNFTWGNGQSYKVLYSQPNQKWLGCTIEGLDEGFHWKGLGTSDINQVANEIGNLTEKLAKESDNPKAATRLFDLQLLTKREQKLILGEISNYGKSLNKIGQNLLKIAKIII
ncbi:hypothetical protein J6A31_03475 [bacterium]|nr:hypothetical protein [bacterium]